MLLNHHINGFLGVVQVEPVVFSLLLLRILLLFGIVERVLRITFIVVAPSDVID